LSAKLRILHDLAQACLTVIINKARGGGRCIARLFDAHHRLHQSLFFINVPTMQQLKLM